MKGVAVPILLLVLWGYSCSGDDNDNGVEAGYDSDSGADIGSGGCGGGPECIGLTLKVDGQSRGFRLYLPPDYDPSRAYPLVFVWHGGGGSAAGAQSYLGIQEQTGSDAAVVYPDGLVPPGSGTSGWEVDPEGYDFAFFDALLDFLKTNYSIDETRVFSAGFSWGAYMTNSLGCYRGDVLNAIASVAGGTPRPKGEDDPLFYGECNGQAAVWMAHGTVDYVIPLSEAETARDVFLANNGCTQTHSPTGPEPCVEYDGCTAPLNWCQHDGGHDWPEFVPAGIWQFFKNQ